MSDWGHCTAEMMQRALGRSGGSGRPITSPETTVGKGLSDEAKAGTEYFSETFRGRVLLLASTDTGSRMFSPDTIMFSYQWIDSNQVC